MQSQPREVVERAARELAFALSGLPVPPTLRVAEVEGRAACLILVWDSRETMPVIGPERHRRASAPRSECRTDILEVIRAAGQPQTRKDVLRALRQAGKQHGPGTVAKALADLTAAGVLANPKDKKGYRLPEWVRAKKTRSLFE